MTGCFVMRKVKIQMNAEELILEERNRQKSVEGWTDEHDDSHDDGEMLKAAVIYYLHGTDNAAPIPQGQKKPIGWPWSSKDWKPKDRKSNLVRAGALALADAERLRRKGQRPDPAVQKYEMIKAALAMHIAA